MNSLEVLFTPADFAALAQRDLTRTTCVVFDVLRATSTMLEALNNGAEAIFPCLEIVEALAWRRRDPSVLLAGERHGLRIGAALTGGEEFDLGNSPREFTAARVSGRRLAMTTTNGTRALRACAGAQVVWLASFANLGATAERLLMTGTEHLCLVCSGTGEQTAYEDVLGAGALLDRLWLRLGSARVDDSVHMARNCFLAAQGELERAIQYAQNGRRLREIPELAADVPFCLAPDRFWRVAGLDADGGVRLK